MSCNSTSFFPVEIVHPYIPVLPLVGLTFDRHPDWYDNVFG